MGERTTTTEQAKSGTIRAVVDEIVKSKSFRNNQIMRFGYNADDDVAKQMYAHLARSLFEPNFKITASNKNIYEFIIAYALGRSDLDKYNVCTNSDNCKAIGIIGNTGSGKSLAMQIFREFCKVDDIKYAIGGKIKRFTPVMISARRIVNEFNSKGYDALDVITNWDSMIIDDLGAENQNAKYYGSEVQVMEYVIEERYNKNLLTHFTTNLDMRQIEDEYGERVRSRLFKSTNLIKMVSSDFRMEGVEYEY